MGNLIFLMASQGLVLTYIPTKNRPMHATLRVLGKGKFVLCASRLLGFT